MTRIELEDDEAVLLHALGVYASTVLKPPMNYDERALADVRKTAESYITIAPAEVMQRLAIKLRVLTPVMTTARPAIVAKWRETQV